MPDFTLRCEPTTSVLERRFEGAPAYREADGEWPTYSFEGLVDHAAAMGDLNVPAACVNYCQALPEPSGALLPALALLVWLRRRR